MVRTHVAIFKRKEMTVSQVADKVLYAGLIEMQELDAQGYGPGATQRPHPNLHKAVSLICTQITTYPCVHLKTDGNDRQSGC